MSSQSAAPSPRVRRVPQRVNSDAADAVFLASSYGLTPDEWQADVLDDWLGRCVDTAGSLRWSAASCGLAVPRQNGKNGALEVRELFGIVILGEKFLHTAHEVKTARKAFLRIASFFENVREYPELAALVKEIRKTNGQEAIVLHNGGSVEFIARSRGSGRGFTVDVLVCDEAQELTAEELAALLPTISAAPSGNPQVILTGTPPKPGRAQGEVFRGMRATGEAGTDPRLAWTDFGVGGDELPDVEDRTLWYRVNPALGGRLNIAEVERELSLMTPEDFAVERLGWWQPVDDGTGRTIPVHSWRDCVADAASIADAPTIVLDVALDRSRSSIGVAGVRSDGRVQGELVDYGPGTGWVVARLLEMHSTWGAPIFLADGSPAMSLKPDIEATGVPVEVIPRDEVVQACGAMLDAVVDRSFARVIDVDAPDLDRVLTAAVEHAQLRTGESYVFTRKGAVDISPLYAVLLARWVAAVHQPAGGFISLAEV